MKIRKRIVSLALFVIVVFSMAIQLSAANVKITPYYNNTATTQANFIIDENGLATATFTCRGHRGIATRIVVDTKIEKQSGSSWVQVEGASWTDESTLYYCSNSHSVQLTESGTYKMTIIYTVSGTGGEADVITREIEETY